MVSNLSVEALNRDSAFLGKRGSIEDARAVRIKAIASYLKIGDKPRWIQPVLRRITRACISLLAWIERWARYCINHIINE